MLSSRTVPGLEQEVYALLTVYQALVRTADDLVTARPGLPAERVSMIVLLNAAADQIVAAHGIAQPARRASSQRSGVSPWPASCRRADARG
ncbi:hypothetical protein ABT298_32370 [Streptomyces sp. NPDC001034]|uniref:hypothetical protein n=1 Tax=Streptomyces sp. NPDC001034 TaxID=3154375 RepID=UPI00332A89A4